MFSVFFWFQLNYNYQLFDKCREIRSGWTHAQFMSNTISTSRCWYEDHDKASNWTAKLTIIESRIIFNHLYLFDNLFFNQKACDWASIEYKIFYVSMRRVFVCSSSFYFFNRLIWLCWREWERREIFIWKFPKKILNLSMFFRGIVLRGETSRITSNISLHFYFLSFCRFGSRKQAADGNIKINKEKYYWRITFRFSRIWMTNIVDWEVDKYLNHNHRRFTPKFISNCHGIEED